MKKVLNYALALIGFFALVLSAFCFIEGNLNVFEWDKGIRFFLMFFWLGTSLTYIVANESKNIT